MINIKRREKISDGWGRTVHGGEAYLVDILGTKYSVELKSADEDNTLKERNLSGYCSDVTKEIVLLDLSKCESWKDEGEHAIEQYYNSTLRHEIIHAYLNESGLCQSALQMEGPWAKNEEMVDWMAIQFPKIVKTFKELDCL